MSTREDVERTLFLYGWGYDEDDLDLMVDCFTSDAVLKRSGGTLAEGKQAIREFYEAARQRRRDAREQTRHVISNVLITSRSETEVDALCYLTLVVTEDGGQSSSVKGGWYRDRLVDTGAAWRFSERIINVDADYSQIAFAAWKPAVDVDASS